MDVLDIARFWSKVDVKGVAQCWPWRDLLNKSGYGEFKVDGQCHPAHRIAFEISYGVIPEGAVIRHECDTPRCVNPGHLVSGTHADNVRDRVIRGRSARGEKSGKAILTEAKVREIRASGLHYTTIARQYGVHPTTIVAIQSRRSWKHIP